MVAVRSGLDISTSNMQHMDLGAVDRKQHAITTDYHLANFFGELVIFRRTGKPFRHARYLFRNSRAQLANPLLRLQLAPGAPTPFIRFTHVSLSRFFEDNGIAFHSRSAMPFSVKSSLKNFSAGLPAFRRMLSSPRLITSIASIRSLASK